MKIDGIDHRTIWVSAEDGWSVEVIDQTVLPFTFATQRLTRWQDAERAIRDMVVRGAPCIGATAAYGICLALREQPGDGALDRAAEGLKAARPTAINLMWAVDTMVGAVRGLPEPERVAAAYARAARICDDDVDLCRQIGAHGLEIIRSIAARKPGEPVNILTHCNAGWLATVDWGTATAPIYMAHDSGLDIHVWVDETRPRNQGGSLTALELGWHGLPHTIVADNAGGHLMQAGQVDLCIVGTDRTAANGDVANKIGTYLKALAARDNGVPFYVALPYTTIDWSLSAGLGTIPIEERSAEEVTHMRGIAADGQVHRVQITAPGSPAANPAFDVTPARLVSGLITERGVAQASREGLLALYPEHRATG